MQGVIALLDQLPTRHDEIRFDGFTPTEIDDLLGGDVETRHHRIVSHVADLSSMRAAGKSLIAGFGGDRGKRIRRSIRLVEDRDGPITVEWASNLPEAHAFFEEMCTLHQARWQAIGEPGVFASKRFARFHRDLIDATFEAGQVALVRVSAGGRTLGCDYSFIQHNRLLGYQWGLAQYEDHRVSIGTVTAAAVMQAALDRGYDEYDHLSGDTLYKRQLSTTSRELVWVTVSLGARVNAIYKLADTKRRAQQLRAAIPPIGELIASR
jgi:CelD/BcsL family acetyltransferase involved in cellulose biosynthesis